MQVEYKQGPTWVEEKKGKKEVLYGYSQTNLDSLVKWYKLLALVVILFIVALICVGSYLFYLGVRYHWATKFFS